MTRLEFQKIYAWAADQLGGLCTPETAIFSIIFSYEENGKSCFCSFTEFARLTGCSRMTVSRAINKLCQLGVIIRYPNMCEYRNSNSYEVNKDMVARWIHAFRLKNK